VKGGEEICADKEKWDITGWFYPTEKGTKDDRWF